MMTWEAEKLFKKPSKEFCDYIQYVALVENGVAATVHGVLLRTCAVRSRDLYFASEGGIHAALRNLMNTFRLLGDGWVIYVDSHRKSTTDVAQDFPPNAPWAAQVFDAERYRALGKLFYTEFYITICYATKEPGAGETIMFSGGARNPAKKDVNTFLSVTDDLFNMYQSVFRDVSVLDSDGLLTYLHSLWGEDHPVIMPQRPFFLNVYLADQTFYPDSITRLGAEYVLAASIHDWPGTTHAGMMSGLLQIPLEFRVSSRFIMLSPDAARKEIDAYRKLHFQKRKSLGALLSEAFTRVESPAVNEEAVALARDASSAMEEMSAGQLFFGKLTTTIIVRDQNYAVAESRLKELIKAVNEEGFICKPETVGTPGAFLGTLPAHLEWNPRQSILSTNNLAHLYPLSDRWEGDFTNTHLHDVTGSPFPHMICRTGSSVFYLNLNVGDLGHTFVVGPSGAGKSFLINTLALQYFRYPNAKVLFFDKDKTSYWPCRNCGGQFYDIGNADSALRFNPFSAIHTEERLTWLSTFLVDFFRSQSIDVGAELASEIFNALTAMKDFPMESRSFQAFRDMVQHEEIRAALDPFIDGEYSHLFTNQDDTFDDSVWTTFEMNTLLGYNKNLIVFVLGYLFHRIEAVLDGNPVLLVIDEGWMFLDDPVFSSRLKNWLKTLRKRNVYVVLATQEVQDLTGPMLSVVVNACQTKILLPNHNAEVEFNKELYRQIGLDDSDIQVIAQSKPKRDYLFVNPRGKQLFDLVLNPAHIAILKGPVKPADVEGAVAEAEILE